MPNFLQTKIFQKHGILLFMLAQLAFFATVGGATGWKMTERKSQRALPVPNANPVKVTPQYDYPWIVSDEQLQTVLLKLRPALREPKPLIGNIDHALRFWGVEAKFSDAKFYSGQELRELLLNHQKFEQAWGADAQPLVMVSKDGVQIRTLEGKATSSHVDHTLAALAEVGTPLTHRIQPDPKLKSQRPLIVRDLLAQALRSFSLNQVEYEWSTLAFALYLPNAKSWTTHEGQTVSFDYLAQRIMRQTYSQGVCFGNHRLHTLTMLLRIDEQHSILQPETRQEILSHLHEASRRLVQSQFDQGYWDGTWSSEKPPEKDRPDQSLANKVLATGHALEWWALAPAELHPPREVLVRAGQWLAKTIGEMDDATVKKNFTFLSHAGRALAIWRGHEPAHFSNEWLKKTPEKPASPSTEKPAATEPEKVERDPEDKQDKAKQDKNVANQDVSN